MKYIVAHDIPVDHAKDETTAVVDGIGKSV
jgi:hypothetical protein